MGENCYSCEIFSKFNDKTVSFCSEFYRMVSPELKSLLTYLFMAWMCFRLCQMLLGKMEYLNDFLKEFVDLAIGSALLQSFEYWQGFTFWIYNLGMDLGVRVLRITSNNDVYINKTDIDTLLFYIEDSFTPVLSKIGLMVSDISWSSFKISLGMIPVAVLYFLLLWRIFASLFNIFVQLFAINLLSPILITFYALPLFKNCIWGTIRILMANALRIVLACGTIGIILTYLNSLEMLQNEDINLSVGTVGYMQMLFTGALLWGAYGTIIETPSLIFNTGHSERSNALINKIQNLTGAGMNYMKLHGGAIATSLMKIK